MHQQLAHVVDALAQAHVELVERGLHLLRLLFLHRRAQQLDLDLQERQRLGDGVVQLARDQGALLAHRGLALQRGRAQAFERAGQMAGQRVEQSDLVHVEADIAAEEQVAIRQL
ncbi:hypothetical protein D9M70_639460 [compost metagenome]